MAKLNSQIKGSLIQVCLIVFSVVLGLYLNEKIADSKNQKESQKLLSLITSEVEENFRLMETLYPYHRQMYGTLDSLLKEEEFITQFADNKYVLVGQLFTRGNFLNRLPASDAWDIGKGHPLIASIDYGQLLILSKIYNQQQLTFEPMDEMFDIFNRQEVLSPKEARANLAQIADRLREIVGREQSLMTYYKKAAQVFDFPNSSEQSEAQ